MKKIENGNILNVIYDFRLHIRESFISPFQLIKATPAKIANKATIWSGFKTSPSAIPQDKAMIGIK